MSIEKQSNRTLETTTLVVIKIFFALLTTFGFFFWIIVLLMVIGPILKGGTTPAWYLYFYPFPVVYFLFCYLSCTRFLQGRMLIILGIIMHIGLVIWAYIGGGLINVITCVVFTLFWFVLYVIRISFEQETQ